MSKHLLAPSILTSDISDLKSNIQMLNRSEADWIHIDVMDGVFVPNITFGFPVIKHIKKHAQMPLDVHLMIVKPERYFEQCKDSGADIVTFHYEASVHAHRSVCAIKELGMKAGIVLNPHSSVSLLEDIVEDLDLVLLMSVNPGFGGQVFIENTFSKISKLRKLIDASKSEALIQIDGGVNLKNYKDLISQGADVLVAGNCVFSSSDPISRIKSLKKV